MEEIWKDVIGYEEKYQVSNLGRVRRCEILNTFLHNRGYVYVNLTKDNTTKHKYVHRLVAESFLPNLNELETVNHINEIKCDNVVENLEWMSHLENNNYGTAIRRRSLTRSKCVLQYTLTGEFVKEWKSCIEIERTLGISSVCISQCCLGKINKSHKYYWEYKN